MVAAARVLNVENGFGMDAANVARFARAEMPSRSDRREHPESLG
jgi:hypothetical protein